MSENDPQAPEPADFQAEWMRDLEQRLPGAAAANPPLVETLPPNPEVELPASNSQFLQEQEAFGPTYPEGSTAQPPAAEHRSAGSGRCVLVGPSNAGKTCTLIALGAACYVRAEENDHELALLGDNPSDNKVLDEHKSKWIGDGIEPPATEARRSYGVEIHTRTRGRWFRRAVEVVTALHCVDGRGGTLFPSEADRSHGLHDARAHTELCAQAREASVLVFVADALQPGADLFDTHLQSILDAVAETLASETLSQPLGVRALQYLGLGERQNHARRKRLRASRVLLLLTKVDELAAQISDQLATQGVTASPLKVAKVLDPVGLAIERLGERPLRQLQRATGRSAQFAVGIASASGFHEETGDTFFRWAEGRAKDERIKAWRPFGIREALLFITVGESGGPVRRVDPDDPLTIHGATEAGISPFGGWTR